MTIKSIANINREFEKARSRIGVVARDGKNNRGRKQEERPHQHASGDGSTNGGRGNGPRSSNDKGSRPSLHGLTMDLRRA
jgi:hypothetical protein